MYHPDDSEFQALASKGDLVPVYFEMDVGSNSPVTVYQKVVSDTSRGFLLESVQGQERLARYSFIGTDPYKIIKTDLSDVVAQKPPLAALEPELGRLRVVQNENLPRCTGGAVG